MPIFWKGRDRRYLACNLSYAEQLGYSTTEDVIGFTDDQLLSDSDKASESYEADQAVIFFKKIMSENSGGYQSVRIPIENHHGDVSGIFGYTFDVSQYKSEFEETFQTLNEIIAVMPGHVYWKDKNCILQGCNDQQAMDAGFTSRNMIVGKTAYDLLYQNQDEEEKIQQAAITNSYDKKIMATNKTITLEEEVVMPDSSIATFLSKKAPLHDAQGNVTGLVGISFDITERKRSEVLLKNAKEQAELASIAKTEFLENMRHDIRTPLTGIVGFAELIADAAQTPQIKNYAKELVKATTALLEFQNEILNAIKISSGKVPLTPASFHLKDLVDKVIDLTKPKAVVKHLFLRSDIDPALPEFIFCDRKRLFRILLELVTNALKFTNEGGVTIKFYQVNASPEKLKLCLSVEDSGIGVPADKTEDIFIRFNRLSAASDGVYEGTGLGLTIVKQFVKELSGEIHVNSTLGLGSIFSVTFEVIVPLQDQDIVPIEKKNHQSTEREHNHEKPFVSKHVLVIEDHEMTGRVNSMILEKFGCVVTWVKDANSAIDAYQNKKFDLVLLDMGLPDFSGDALATYLRDIDRQYGIIQLTPIIALTAHMDKVHSELVQKGVIDAVYLKPLMSHLAEKIIDDYIVNSKIPLEIVDLKLGKDRIGGDLEKSREMITLLLQHIDNDYAAFQEALLQRDVGKVSDINHRLMGALVYCGVPQLEATCRILQNQIKSGSSDSAIFVSVEKILEAISTLKTVWRKSFSVSTG